MIKYLTQILEGLYQTIQLPHRSQIGSRPQLSPFPRRESETGSNPTCKLIPKEVVCFIYQIVQRSAVVFVLYYYYYYYYYTKFI